MPQTLAVGDIVEVKFFCSLVSQVSVNIRHYRVTAVAGAAADDADAVVEVHNHFDGEFQACMTNQAYWQAASVQIIKPVAYVPQVKADASAVGASAFDALPGQVAGIITLTTARAGRKYRGRIYVPFPSEDHNGSTNLPSSGYISALADLGEKLTDVITVGAGGDTAQLTPIIYHRADSTYDYITGFTPRGAWATQRRRSAINRGDSPAP